MDNVLYLSPEEEKMAEACLRTGWPDLLPLLVFFEVGYPAALRGLKRIMEHELKDALHARKN